MKHDLTPDWTSLLRKAQAKRAQILGNAYRVINGLEDGLEGVTLDRYNTHWQLQFFDRTWFWCENVLCDAIRSVFQPRFLVVKERLDPAGKSLEKPVMRVVHGAAQDSACEVLEGSARFKVDLLDTVNPGLFLDMRENRLALAPLAAGGEMLNLFCYTGSFSVHARLAGATRAVNVDVSAKILDRVRENYQVNKIDVQRGEFFRGDAEEYLRYAVRKGLKFRTIVLDPPSFSRSDRGIFQVKTHLGDLAELCTQLVEPAGRLLVATNYSGMTGDDLQSLMQERATVLGCNLHMEWVRGQGSDFPGSGRVKESCLVAGLWRLA